MTEPEAPDGPPYTHTFRPPATEYDDEGEPLPPRIQPSLTVYREPLEPFPLSTYTAPTTFIPMEPETALVETPFRAFRSATLHIGDTTIPVDDIQFDWTRDESQDAENYTMLRAGSMADVSFAFEVPPEQAGPIAAFVMGVYRHPSHDFAVGTLRAFRIKPRDIGLELGCACHTLPNPAARDYRRRTKHRNRRRR